MYHLAALPPSAGNTMMRFTLRRSDLDDGAGPRWRVECCNCLARPAKFLSNRAHEKVPPNNYDHLCRYGLILWGNLCWCDPVQRLQKLSLLSLLPRPRRNVWCLRRSPHSETLGKRPHVKGQSRSTTLNFSTNCYEPSSRAHRGVYPQYAVCNLEQTAWIQHNFQNSTLWGRPMGHCCGQVSVSRGNRRRPSGGTDRRRTPPFGRLRASRPMRATAH